VAIEVGLGKTVSDYQEKNLKLEFVIASEESQYEDPGWVIATLFYIPMVLSMPPDSAIPVKRTAEREPRHASSFAIP
jgi:hypothetical protein